MLRAHPIMDSVARPDLPYDGDDFYCDVALPHLDRLEVVHEGPGVVAFHHTRPTWAVHVVVIPRRHVPSLIDLSGMDEALARELLDVVGRVAADVEREHGAAAVLTNVGTYQDSRHLHVHVRSGPALRPDPTDAP